MIPNSSDATASPIWGSQNLRCTPSGFWTKFSARNSGFPRFCEVSLSQHLLVSCHNFQKCQVMKTCIVKSDMCPKTSWYFNKPLLRRLVPNCFAPTSHHQLGDKGKKKDKIEICHKGKVIESMQIVVLVIVDMAIPLWKLVVSTLIPPTMTLSAPLEMVIGKLLN